MASLHSYEQFLQPQVIVQVLLCPAAPIVKISGDDHWFIAGHVSVDAIC